MNSFRSLVFLTFCCLAFAGEYCTSLIGRLHYTDNSLFGSHNKHSQEIQLKFKGLSFKPIISSRASNSATSHSMLKKMELNVMLPHP